ncbi:MAG TPA: J domain-containing protein [Chthonomonadaceae bacterium]|nr:J domain-containing protein [Chthonomonadaceae bacterium]
MSIPQRLYRIAKSKLNELKDRIEQLDAETQLDPETERKLQQAQYRRDARRELEDALSTPAPAPPPASSPPHPSDRSTVPSQPSLPRRTPEEIARGTFSKTAPPPTSAPTTTTPTAQSDPLAYHYRLLGLEPGADWVAVQNAYNNLAARAEPGRFAAGSEEERTAQEIRKRLDASYQVLRDALDPTARRFDLIEY